MLLDSEIRNEKEKIEAKQAAYFSEIKRKSGEAKAFIEDYLENNNPDWFNNEGNSHTRRTRWSDRAERIGVGRGYGSLVRDCFEAFKKNIEF